MKRILLFLIGIMSSVSMLAEEYVDNYGIKYTYDSTDPSAGATLTDGKGLNASTFTITASFIVSSVTYSVTSIADEAFANKVEGSYKDNDKPVYVIIPKGITTIGVSAFRKCSNLKLLELPSTLTSIGDGAFRDCGSLVHVCCKAQNVPSCNGKTFQYSKENPLMTLYVPTGTVNSYTSSWGGYFQRFYEGEMVKVNNENMTYICATGSRKEATLFEGGDLNKSAQTIIVPASFKNSEETYNVKSIGRSAFSGFSNLSNLEIPNGVTTICPKAFQNCTSLKKLVVPSSLTTINSAAFSGCTNLMHICSRQNSASYDNYKLSLNSLISGLPNIPLMNIYLDVDDGTWEAIDNNKKSDNLKTDLNTKFPGGVYHGEMIEFTDNNGLRYISSTASYEATLTSGLGLNDMMAVVSIPGTVTYNSRDYRVKTIEKYAFKGKTSITDLTIQENIVTIGVNAFEGCNKLRKVVLPSTLTNIGENAFKSCSNLVHVVSKIATPQGISTSVFPDKTKSSGTLYVPSNEALYNYTLDAATGWKEFQNMMVGDMVEINAGGLTFICLQSLLLSPDFSPYAIVNNAAKDVTRVEIPETVTYASVDYSVTQIASNAFLNCKSLEKVVLPSSLTSIGDYAFDGCSKLAYVVCSINNPININTNGDVFPKDQAILFVPGGVGYSYKTSSWNSYFAKILEGDMGEMNSGNMKYVYATVSREAILVKGETSNPDVIIPPAIEDNNGFLDVTDIWKSAFSGNTSLVNLTISTGISAIGASAFAGCTNLQKVVLPSTLKSIGDMAFENCSKISEITSKVVAADVFTFSENVFYSDVYQIATVFVPIGNPAGSTITAYRNKAYWSSFPISNYLEGEKLQNSVNNMTYEYLTGPKTATLISTTTSEKNVTIPDSVTINDVKYGVIDIGQNAFKGNTSIERLTISEKVKTIGAYAFQGCTGLKKIEFPSTLTDIGEKAFDNCKSITHICSKISANALFEFNKNVFSVYTASLYVPEGTLETYTAKNGWNNFTNNTYTGYFVDDLTKDYLSYDCLITGTGNTAAKTATLTKSATSTADVVIPDSVFVGGSYYRVTNIRQSAFSGNSKLVNITIPTYVTTIGDNAFNNCNYIANIITKIKVPTAISENVFSTASATLYVPVGTRSQYSNLSGWKRFQPIYEGEMKSETPGDMTYVYATGDKTAILVSTTTTAANVIIPDSFAVAGVYYKVIAIDKSVFKNKTSIVNLTLPATLTQIGDGAFDGCKNIATITSKATVPPVLGNNVFSITTATLYVPVGSRSSYQNASGWNSFSPILEGERNDVTLNGLTYVFATGDKTATIIQSTLSGQDIIIPGTFNIGEVTYNVTAIDNSVFKDNKTLVNLKISENVKTIGAYAFQGCSLLKRVELPSTLSVIGEKAFDNCNNLVHVSSNITSPTDIPENTFSTYSKATLYVPEGKTASYQGKLGWQRFENVIEGNFVDEIVSTDGLTYVCLKKGSGQTFTTTAIVTKASVSSSYVSIPASLQLGKESYKVTTIGNSAFNNSSKLVNLTLSENISSIEDNAFANCLNISVVTSMIKEPVGFNDNVFSAYIATLYVPEGTRAKYQAAKGWKNFATILEGERNETTTEDGMTYIYATGDKTATLVKVASVDKDIIVRGSFKIGEITYKVTAIDKSVFKDKKSIVSLKIEENIKSIGANAFQNCVNLEKIELPSTMTEIGECAFDNCTRLSHVVSRVKSPFPINGNVFAESIYPTAKLYVPTVTSADYKTTAGWENFKNILVGDMKVVIQDDITYYCVQGPNIATLVKASTSAAEVTIPTSVKDGKITYNVTDVGAHAFSGIGSLKKLTISKGVKSIGTGAFQNCSNLEKVVLPASLSSIDDYAFDKCNRLTLVMSDGESPVEISDNVFSSYTATLIVPIGSADSYRNADGWKLFSTILEGDMLEAEVDGMTYAYVTGPRTATLIKGVTEETDLTIRAAVTIGGVEYAVTEIGESAFANTSSFVNLTISGGIKSIGANAFRNCAYLTKVELPSSLTYIGSGAFSKCDRLSHVVSFILDPFQINDDVFATIAYNNGTLYVPVKTGKLYKGASGWSNFLSVLEGEMYETTLDGMTYAYIPNLKIAKLTKGISDATDVTIPSSISIDGISYQVEDIERSAFYGFNSLVNLTVSEGIKTIGYTAFKNCYNLKTVSLPSSLVSIGDYAFENCKKIAMISCEGEKPIAISNNVFSSSSMDLYVPVGAVSLYQADSNWGQFNIMESTTISIGKSGKASYCGNLSLDFSFSDEIKAYIATGFDEAEGIIWLTRVKDVPAGVPVLIKGVANKTYSVAVTDSKNSFYKNMFKGNTSGEQIKVEETEGNLVNYYLSGDGTFKKVKGYVNLGNNKCYLQLPGVFEPEEVGMDQTVTIKESGKASFAAPVDLDFTNVKGLKAFTATGYDKSTKTIWLTRVMKVQKGEGVLLKGNAKDYEIPSVAVQSSYMNMFVGNTSGEKIRVEEKSADGSLTNYYLNSDGSFVSVKGYVNIGDNKCYLGLPTSMVAASSTRSSEDNYLFEEAEMIKLPIDIKSIGNDGDDTTGIRNLTPALSEGEGEWYTLQGQRVTKPGKGLYIKNGKKILIK